MNETRAVAVTGAASGMGLAISRLFSDNHHPVAMLDVQGDALERRSGRLRDANRRVAAHHVDVADRAGMDAAYAAIRDTLGPVRIVIANAGISASAPFRARTADTWSRMIAVNLTGTFSTIQPATEDMIAAGWGRIVTVPPSLIDAPLAREGERSGEVPPLEVLAGMIPIARPGTPEDIAYACEYLCSEKAAYVTGQELNVNGGG